MKLTTTIITIIFCCLTTMITLAQPTKNIEADIAKAEAYYQQSLSFKECSEERIEPIEKAIKLYKKHKRIEKVVEMKGWLAFNLNCFDIDMAIETAEEAITLAEKKLGNAKHLATYNAYISLAYETSYEDVEAAINYFSFILNDKKTPNITYFEALTHLTDIYYRSLESYKVEVYLEEFEERLQHNSNPHLKRYVIKLNEVKAMIHFGLDAYDKVILYGKEALTQSEKYNFPFDISYVYADLSTAYSYIGNKDLGRKYLHLFIENTDTTDYYVIDYYNFYGQIASLYMELDDNKNALKYDIKAVNIITPYAKEYPDLMGSVYDNLALSYLDDGQYEKAKKTAEQALNHDFSPLVISHYLEILCHFDETDKELEYVQKGLQILDEDFKPNSIFDNPKFEQINKIPKVIIDLTGYKSTYLYDKAQESNDKEEKLKYLKAAVEIVETSIRLERKFVFAHKGFDMFVSCIPCSWENEMITYKKAIYDITQKKEDLVSIFDYMERIKGKALLNHFTENPLPKKLAEQENTITQNIRDYQHQITLATADSIAFYEKKLFDENQKMEELVDYISKNHPEHANYFYNTNFASANAVQSDLDEQTAFISYVITDNHLSTYIINNNQQQSFQIEINDDFYDKITQFTDLLQNPFLVQTPKRNQFIKLSNQLYQQLIEPLETYIQGKSRLIISPNNDLFYLPFEALLATNAEKPFHQLDFLVKQFEITYQYSATTYDRLRKQPRIIDKSFVGFAPIFENGLVLDEQTRSFSFLVDSLYKSVDNNQLSALPNTRLEVETINNLLPTSKTNTTLFGKTATKNALLKSMNSDVQFLHIATHGLVNYTNPNLSALACYNSSNHQGNLLFANEIQSTNVKADLVILSSCESGIGIRTSGEGLIALNRSFIIGGANNVIFSLWKVNDEYSSTLMIDFYRSYLENPSYTSALRQAKLKMLENEIMANPRFWAAFVLIGE